MSEKLSMSDLSKVLGELYEQDADAPPVQQEAAAQDRKGELDPKDQLASVLDEAIASVPEELISEPGPEPESVLAAEEWAEKLEAHDNPSHLHVKGALRGWEPADDDIIPSSKKKRGKK